jgi:uncharacterized protein YbaR (Trm112 family)
MAIVVTCPSCRTRFQVSEKFAGQTGPCPKCKKPLRVPTKEEEVKIHAPEEFASGGRSVTGALVTKPVTHHDLKMEPVAVAAIIGSILMVLVLTWGVGRTKLFEKSLVVGAIGLLLVSPPLVVAGYAILRNDELEPYRGVPLYIRAGICALAYMALWGVYIHVVAPRVVTGEIWNWVYVPVPFVIIGALTALATLDLDFGSGVFHYSFYLLVTILLRWVGGMGWIWETSGGLK